MSESADTTATRTTRRDLAASMPDHVLPWSGKEDRAPPTPTSPLDRHCGVVVAAAVGGLIPLRALAHEGGILPLSALSAWRAVVPPSPGRGEAALRDDRPAHGGARRLSRIRRHDRPERAGAAAAAATGAPPAASSLSTDHVKGYRVIVGTTADSVTVAVHDGVAAGATLSLTLNWPPGTRDDRRALSRRRRAGGQGGHVRPDGSLRRASS
jgi:hypothetical protein